MAAAAVLSLVVHAAILLGRASAGSAAPSPLQLAPVLSTRAVAIATPRAGEAPPQVPAPAPPPAEAVTAMQRPLPELAPSRVEPVAPTPIVPSPPPRQPDPASAVSALPPPTLALAPVVVPSASPSPAYMGSGVLDPPPRPLTDIDPAVPAEAGARGGVVVLRLFINEQGGVDKAEVLNSAPPGLFDASALEAFGNARFSPGYIAGVPVKSQVTFEVKFRGLGTGAATSGRTY